MGLCHNICVYCHFCHLGSLAQPLPYQQVGCLEATSLKTWRTVMVWIRVFGAFEGLTLVLLICLAVPLKYLVGNPMWVTVLGPIHGFAFTLFSVAVISGGFEGKLNSRECLKLLLWSCVPLGALRNERVLRRMTLQATPGRPQS